MDWVHKLPSALARMDEDAKLYRVIVEVTDDSLEEVKAFIMARNGKIFRELSIISALVLELPPDVLQDLAKMGQVKKISIDTKSRALLKNDT